MRVALVQCPVWGTREPPLGIVQLSGILKSGGFEVRSFDLNNHLYRKRDDTMRNLWAWEQSLFWYNRERVHSFFRDFKDSINTFFDEIARWRPDVIGFSVTSSTYFSSCEAAKLYKKMDGGCTVVFGGQGLSDAGMAKRVFHETPVDYFLTGEAETSLVSLLESMDGNREASLCGVISRKTERITVETPVLYDLDSVPYMDFTDLKITDYDDSEHISLMASRGCIWNCAFCSSRSFWKGYRYMSGERVHQEINFHRTMNGSVGHVDFADLVFNGNMKRVTEFCRLMIDYPPYDPAFKFQWIANCVIRADLTREVLGMMKDSGCQRLIFGIESGSPRVLKIMKKKYDPVVARRVIRQAYEAGIKVTANFMFGFPGETEEDFKQTLSFINDTGRYIERAYPSRTYCALEERSEIHENPSAYGIREPFNHHLYWETVDGKNTYPVRLDRCKRFEEFCAKTGLKTDRGVGTDIQLDNWHNLAVYYEHKGDYGQAARYYNKYLEKDPGNLGVCGRVNEMMKKMTAAAPGDE